LPEQQAPTILRRNERCAKEARMFCLEDGLTLDALFAFTAFVLVFAIGLGLGLLVRGL
jgi:hypothetical protein